VIPVGHANLLVDERVFQEIMEFLSASEAVAGDSKILPFSKKK
jgi:hypothetical protein